MHHDSNGDHVLFFDEIDATHAPLVGGKAKSLAALSRIEGVRVPEGFCVTTTVFDRIVREARIDDPIARLAGVTADDCEAIATLSAEIRGAIEAVRLPSTIADAIGRAIARLGEQDAYAVRSSATAEDLEEASFAGQQDTFLNVAGVPSVIEHITKCLASLFTERAVTYRLRAGFDQRTVRMAVVVQRMVSPDVAGILFTAHPVTGNRKMSSIEATVGLGESLVSGHVNADLYEVRDATIVKKTVRGAKAVLTEEQVAKLEALGRRIEARFGRPQDIEWCLRDDEIFVVQSRPITTLFPPPPNSDGENHVYLSVGHQQMMTDALKPLGVSFWKLIAAGPMHEAGGRLFVDVTRPLSSPAGRAGLLDLVRKSDPLMSDALQKLVDRGDFIRELPGDAPPPILPKPAPIDPDPSRVTEFIARTETALATLKRDIREKTGGALFDFILADINETRRILHDPQSMQVVLAAIGATWWLNEKLEAWLGEKNAADTLAQSVPNNVTSEMGLALLDVADVIRPHAEVVAFLKRADDRFLDRLDAALAGGREARAAVDEWLAKYGARCPGEIDITRPRFAERPALLLPTLVSHIQSFAPGESKRRFERGREEAEKKATELLSRVRALADGEAKAAETKGMIDRVRAFMGYREYPKFGMVSRMFVYKQALLEEAARLVEAGVIAERDDIFFLSFEELHDVVRTRKLDASLVRERREAYAQSSSLRPPRVLTSDGEAIIGSYQREDLPPGALVGLAVSAGTVEGRARVILDMAKADLEPGDILVTPFTDPSFTPLFVAIKGLVTEVGGLMTHGAVIAREYGLPAVVGVERATQRIRDGQRIRVNGSDGLVEILA